MPVYVLPPGVLQLSLDVLPVNVLPPGVLVTFRMVNLDGGSSSEGEGSEDDDGDRAGTGPMLGSSNGQPPQGSYPVALKRAPGQPPSAPEAPSVVAAARGLCVGLTWLQARGQALQVRVGEVLR